MRAGKRDLASETELGKAFLPTPVLCIIISSDTPHGLGSKAVEAPAILPLIKAALIEE